MSPAPQRTVKPLPAVTVFIAGLVEMVPPAVFRLIITSEVASSFVFEMVIVPDAVQTKVPLRAAGSCKAPFRYTPVVLVLPSVVVLLPWPIAVFPITFSFVSPEASG